MNAAVATAATLTDFYRAHRRRLWLWAALVLSAVVVLLARDPLVEQGVLAPELITLGSSALLAVFGAALACEYLDSSLGMGYGTTLTPLLLLAGFEPLQIVPAVLFSELVTGLTAGVMHHRDGNIDLRRDHHARRTFWLLATLSAVGAISAVLLAIRLSTQWFSLAIALIVLSMGLITLFTARRQLRYRPAGILAIGSIAAFNKGLSGGGYGPLVTSGQVVSGVAPRQAVAITSMAEALTCLIGLIAYLLLKGGIDWSLALPLTAGALLSVPLATVTVRRLPEALIRGAVGVLTLTLGGLLALKLLL
ncbi:sulfite exporter TauE/SafE family protein [Marichromatium bheemlicum]|uniref:Probable membrane transporter protein n=1 Tax=Marichromatium bheemlicum TaxID=365339 RepID=A0ABX1I7U0_9GAMM|nr:sulfite exporter TauE/SafE family protein [Marichromatium bheemlicum]NKN33624.1 sulfite exporter TauE/SafE family protein [Marichromatium bheemlicum]